MKGIPINLLKTFIIAFVASAAVNCLYYTVSQRNNGYDYSHVVPLIISGSFFLNCILLVMSVPALFLANVNFWNNIKARLLLYFSGSVIFIITTAMMKLSKNDMLVYLINGIVFLIVHTIFYRRLLKNNSRKAF